MHHGATPATGRPSRPSNVSPSKLASLTCFRLPATLYAHPDEARGRRSTLSVWMPVSIFLGHSLSRILLESISPQFLCIGNFSQLALSLHRPPPPLPYPPASPVNQERKTFKAYSTFLLEILREKCDLPGTSLTAEARLAKVFSNYFHATRRLSRCFISAAGERLAGFVKGLGGGGVGGEGSQTGSPRGE